MASRKDIEGYVEEAIDNIRNDRAVASNLLVDLMNHIKQDDARHQYSGQVAAKYLEVLQRSNEQLVKITSLLSKKKEAQAGLTPQDKEEIYDIINEG
jgi:hypothetical protein|tara:strand:- start:382 stop:672 length:291 start_codon:yes stop_codon:yes gene_type:complete